MLVRPSQALIATALLALLLIPSLVPAARAGEDDDRRRDWDVYQRDVPSIERAVVLLAAEARSREAGEVLVAFDQITFRPPPGGTEYAEAHDYGGDLGPWLDAIQEWADDWKGNINVVGTLGPSPLRVGPPGWRASLTQALAYPWDSHASFRGFEPAARWISRWVPRENGMVVLISGDLGPVRWVKSGRVGLKLGDESWRRHLLAPGTYWVEPEIEKVLARKRAALVVVAPEVCFGDELVMPALPALPWASRPRRMPTVRLDRPQAPPDRVDPVAPPSAPSRTPAARRAALRAALDALLRDHYPDPVQRKRVIDRILAEEPLPEPREPRSAPVPPTTDGRPPLPVSPPDPILYGRRFRSDTALWFPHYGGTVLFNNHAPSAFGHWPYARVAAATGGRYLTYPFPASSWLDLCPRDAHQLKRLAPELGPRSRLARRRAGDPALQALARAEALVVQDTPWADDWGARRAHGWDAFETLSPLELTRGFRLRRKPFDRYPSGSFVEFRRHGEALKKLVREYDAALAVLDRALERVRKGKDTRSAPRSVADLRLGRFWFAMSAFHLEALGIYVREIERFVPEGYDLDHERLGATYLRTIRLSDCLDAYDDRVLAPEDEARYERAITRAWHRIGTLVWPDGHVVPGQQGNVLHIPEADPNHRAKRSISSVLRHLDRRLMPRALEMIEAAREVMRHHAKTPWGWTTYYSDAYTFVFLPVNSAVWASKRSGMEGEDEPGPITPSPRGGGGSTPGGPITPP